MEPSAPELQNPTPPAPAAAPAPITVGAPVVGMIPTGKMSVVQNGLLWAILSLAFVAVGFFVGFGGLLGAAIGAYAVRKGQLASYKPAIILGGIGLALNAVWLIVVLFAR
jgi:hypothetical protein